MGFISVNDSSNILTALVKYWYVRSPSSVIGRGKNDVGQRGDFACPLLGKYYSKRSDWCNFRSASLDVTLGGAVQFQYRMFQITFIKSYFSTLPCWSDTNQGCFFLPKCDTNLIFSSQISWPIADDSCKNISMCACMPFQRTGAFLLKLDSGHL